MPVNNNVSCKMKTILEKYKINAFWHFTDKSNLELIKEHKGLLSLGELERKGINVPISGGNQWSHDADKIKGVQEYVHLAFIQEHPMLYIAKQEGRIPNPVWLKIDSSVILKKGVCFTSDVSNKTEVSTLQPEEAKETIDFDVLFTRTDWTNPEIQVRRQNAKKSEILIPNFVPIEKILGVYHG